MNTLEHVAAEYLLNSLWQTPLLFGVAWVLARMLRRLGPAAEHRVWVGGMLAQCVLPACSAPWLAATLDRLLLAGVERPGTVSYTLGVAKPMGDTGSAMLLAQLAIAVWTALTVIMLGRLVWQMLEVRRLAHGVTPLMLDGEGTAWLQTCCARLRIARVELASADAVKTPLTFGLFRPMLLLPPGFAERVSATQLKAALGHELAHVARRDAAKQMLYQWLSLPLHYHPAAWLTLAHVAETRERVCDGMAAEVNSGPRQYARSLLELASLLTAQRPAQSHAIGLFDANQLERRILMLNRRTLPLARSVRIGLITGSALVATAVCSAAVALHLDPPYAETVLTAAQSARVSGGVMAGQLVSKVTPVYPPDAKQAKIQGAVVLSAVIGKDGVVENLQVVSGPEALRTSALDAVRQWVYKPYLLNGEPTEVETTITVNYSLAGPDVPEATRNEPVSANSASDVVAPRLLSQVDPVYPAAARRAKIGGEVIVGIKVGTDGKVSEVAALSGPEELRAAAIDAARQYVFAPATRNGQPVPVDLKVSLKFQVF